MLLRHLQFQTIGQKICLLAIVLLGVPSVQADAPLDVRLVIDISGSMAESDPDNRRADALSMFIRVLPETAYAGVWTFGAQVNQLVRHDLAGPLWKNIALTRTAKLPAHALRSNLPEALQQASWDWAQPSTTGPRHILLLTDGAVDVGDSASLNEQATEQLLGKLVPQLVKANIRLHVLAMADAPGAELLSQLAAATGGMALEGITPDQLLSQFLAAIDSVAAASQVPLNAPAMPARSNVQGALRSSQVNVSAAPAINPNQNLTLSSKSTAMPLAEPSARVFRIDAGIGSVDLLWLADTQVELQLTNPQGQSFSRSALPERSRWHVGRGFELVSITSPSPGLWRMKQAPGVVPASTAAPQARMLAYADLQLQLLDPRGALAPQALQSVDAQLSNGQGQALVDPDFLSQIEVNAYLDTARETQVVVVEPGVREGQFRATLPSLVDVEEGVLRFEAVSDTFARGVRMPFQVRSPVHLELHPQGQGALGWIKIGVDGLAPDTLSIAAKVRRPPAPAQWIPAIQQPGGVWKLLLDGSPGQVELDLDVQGKYLSKKDFSFRGETLNLVFPLAATQSFKLDKSGLQIQAPAQPDLPTADADPVVQSLAPSVLEAPAATAAENGADIASSAIKPAVTPEVVLEAEPEPVQAMLPLWFVGLVSLMNLGVCAGLGWLLRPSAASRDLLAKLKAQLAVDADSETAPEAA